MNRIPDHWKRGRFGRPILPANATPDERALYRRIMNASWRELLPATRPAPLPARGWDYELAILDEQDRRYED